MDAKDIIIVVLVVMAVFLLGIILGRRKSIHASANIDPDSIDKQTENVNHKKTSRNYTKEFDFLEKHNKRRKQAMTKRVEHDLFENFHKIFMRIQAADEHYNYQKDEHSLEEMLQLMTEKIDLSFSDIGSVIKKQSELISKFILNGYKQQLDAIFMGQNFEKNINKYCLSSDQQADQQIKISSSILSKFSIVFAKCIEVDQKKRWLISNYREIEKIREESIDWGSYAKNFAGGAIAMANPIIGVPLIVSNWFSQSKKNKEKEIFVESYFKQYDDYSNTINELVQEFSHAHDQIVEYFSGKYDEIYDAAISSVLKETVANGFEINQYFSWIYAIDVPQIEAIEKKYNSLY